MTNTASQLKEIRQEFARLKPSSVTLDGNRAMTVKQAIFTLAPALERMKKRGFDTQEIVEKLHEKGIEVKPQTLTKYLTEARRQREGRKTQKRDTPPPRLKGLPGDRIMTGSRGILAVFLPSPRIRRWMNYRRNGMSTLFICGHFPLVMALASLYNSYPKTV